MALRQEATRTSHMDSILLGFFLGAILTLLFFVFSFVGSNLHGGGGGGGGGGEREISWDGFFSGVFPVYRLVGLPVLGLWLWSLNVFIWERSRIDHSFIFELDHSLSLSSTQIFKIAAFSSLLWLISFTFYIGVLTGHFWWVSIHHKYFPFILVVTNLAILFCPFDIFHRSSRKKFFQVLFHVAISPFGKVNFKEFYLGDVLTSTPILLLDLEYSVCYYVDFFWSNNHHDFSTCTKSKNIVYPIFAGLPLFWRLLQCIRRHRETKDVAMLPNAGKYATGFAVILYSALHGNLQVDNGDWAWQKVGWVVLYIFSTLYMYAWDVTMDWGLIHPKSPSDLLRPNLLFKSRLVYYWAMTSNFVMRFFWSLSVSPVEIDIGIRSEIFDAISQSIELSRRMQWSVFRVENEQVQNNLKSLNQHQVQTDSDDNNNPNQTLDSKKSINSENYTEGTHLLINYLSDGETVAGSVDIDVGGEEERTEAHQRYK